MTQYKVENTQTTDINNSNVEFNVQDQSLDFSNSQTETYWYFTDAKKYIGYYKTIPEIRQSVLSLARWTAGKGYTSPQETELELITGWGEDTFDSIMKNLIVMKKIVGDAFAEIMRDDEDNIINIKPISPERIRVVVDKQGLIKRYDYLFPDGKTVDKPLAKENVLHLCNDRLGDEIHGISALESIKEIVDARNEAIDTYRKILKRNLALGIMYIDTDDKSKIADVNRKYQDAVKNGEVLVLPKEGAELKDVKVATHDFLSWIRYLEDFFYQAIGVPKIILGGSADYTEASSKVGYLTFEQVYMTEQRELEQDLWNQAAIKVTFDRPVSLKDNVQEDENKNTSQVGFQPNDTQAQVGRTE